LAGKTTPDGDFLRDRIPNRIAAPCGVGALHPSAGNFRQVGDPDQTILTGERERSVAALSLVRDGDPVIAGVVDRDGAAVANCQPVGFWKDCVTKSFCAPTDPAIRVRPATSPTIAPPTGS
jgi:hypothetical protein